MHLPKSDGIIKHFLECHVSKIKTDLLPELSRLFLERKLSTAYFV